MDEDELIYDWNTGGERSAQDLPSVELNDETLRDGLQSPSVRSPTISEKLQILHLMHELGLRSANVGLPGAGPRVTADVITLVREIRDQRLGIAPNCAARTLSVDIDPIAEASMATGVTIEASLFIGSSPIRQYAEDWTLDGMLRHTRDAVEYAVRLDLPVMFVTEDTTRAHPDTLRRLYTEAIEAGARRICVADTVGHATPGGVMRLLNFIRAVVTDTGESVKIDWHGHNDRGLALANSLFAVAAGADRVHGTALGIGERVGNTPMDQLLVNFRLAGWIQNDLRRLGEYCDFVSEVTGLPVPANYPVLGRDAFRTATGVHAAAVIKAIHKGDDWLANRVYSGVPAEYFGRTQSIEIGPMSGQSNVIYWLESRGIDAHSELVDLLFQQCKANDTLMTDDQLRASIATWTSGRQAPAVNA